MHHIRTSKIAFLEILDNSNIWKGVLNNNVAKYEKLHVLLTYLQKSNKHKFKKHKWYPKNYILYKLLKYNNIFNWL